MPACYSVAGPITLYTPSCVSICTRATSSPRLANVLPRPLYNLSVRMTALLRGNAVDGLYVRAVHPHVDGADRVALEVVDLDGLAVVADNRGEPTVVGGAGVGELGVAGVGRQLGVGHRLGGRRGAARGGLRSGRRRTAAAVPPGEPNSTAIRMTATAWRDMNLLLV